MSRKPRHSKKLAALKAEIWAELKRGEDIVETELHTHEEPGKYYGLCVNDQTVYVNPQPSIVESVLHELLHRAHPKMSEETVTLTAVKILTRMTNAEVRKWAKQYKAVARKRRTPLKVDSI